MIQKREIIIEVPNQTYGHYRVVCQFGYNNIVNTHWWGYLQIQTLTKRWPWSKSKLTWEEVDRCWWYKHPEDLDDLKRKAMDFYDENVELEQRIIQKAMSL